ncbi:MAG: hypothetical protein MK510_03475 [SAR324 cluster bacterium]|nr:hypothetical protein [SAR324 cluster bacterium]
MNAISRNAQFLSHDLGGIPETRPRLDRLDHRLLGTHRIASSTACHR